MTAYRICTDRDIPALKAIWLSCFEEREDAAELFFKRNKSAFHAYACEKDGRIVSALYLIDCSLNSESAHYLCGAATLPDYRGQGLMSALIEYALDDAKRRGDRYSLLLPASESLYGFYARFGYQPACAVKSAILETDTARSTDGTPDLQRLQKECFRQNFLIWDGAFIRFAASYYACYGARTVQSENAFAIYESDGDLAEVYYAVSNDIGALKALLNKNGISRFSLTGAADCPLFDGEIKKPFGMILPLCNDRIPDNVFIGITLQ